MQRSEELWYHVVWATRDRLDVLIATDFKLLWDICKEREEEWQFYLDAVGGTGDHAHLLLSIHPGQSVARVIGWIKGSTSHAMGTAFSWQSGYAVQTISRGDLPRIRQYIEHQGRIHLAGATDPDLELP